MLFTRRENRARLTRELAGPATAALLAAYAVIALGAGGRFLLEWWRACRRRGEAEADGSPTPAPPFGNGRAEAQADWPQTPGELLYQLDMVLETFQKVQEGRKLDLLEELLDCVDWREQFGSAGSGFLKPEEIADLKRFYRAKFADSGALLLAEQTQHHVMTALLATGDFSMSEEFKRLGREQPELWQEAARLFWPQGVHHGRAGAGRPSRASAPTDRCDARMRSGCGCAHLALALGES